jgi:hypothetical protein
MPRVYILKRFPPEKVAAMQAARLQGMTLKDIGVRFQCSENAARKYCGHIKPGRKEAA